MRTLTPTRRTKTILSRMIPEEGESRADGGETARDAAAKDTKRPTAKQKLEKAEKCVEPPPNGP